MTRKNPLLPVCIALAAFAVIAGSFAIAQPAKDSKDGKDAAGQPEMPLPPGWSAEDMQACMAAGTPGDQHKMLAKSAGTWECKSKWWMAPNTEPMDQESTSVATVIMDGRFVRSEMKGDMPWGPWHGESTVGYDNALGKFVGTWMENQGTGIMFGTGEMAKDGKTINWKYTYQCPITNKPTVMRQIETHNSDKSMTLEMFCTDPKTGKEFKCGHFDFTKVK